MEDQIKFEFTLKFFFEKYMENLPNEVYSSQTQYDQQSIVIYDEVHDFYTMPVTIRGGAKKSINKPKVNWKKEGF